MQEQMISCNSCGRHIPITSYCIYCGSAIVEKKELKEKQIKKVESEESTLIVSMDELKEKKFLPSKTIKKDKKSIDSEENILDQETAETVEELKKFHLWKIKLWEILIENGVTQEIFYKLYNEYNSNINNLSQFRDEKSSYYKKEYDSNKKKLKELKLKLEEIMVRARIGEIPEEEYSNQKPQIENMINVLTQDISLLEKKIFRIDNLMFGVPPKQILELETIMKKSLDFLDKQISSDSFSHESKKELRRDLEAMLNSISCLISEKKNAEKELRERLDTLEARYKVGEISISELESQRKNLLAELEQLWI
jgi:hypothetical protein